MYVTTSGTRTALTATTVDTNKNGIDTASSMYVTTSGTRTALTATEINNLIGSSSKCMDTASSIYGINATARYKIGATNVDEGNTYYGLNTASSMYVSTSMGARTALTATSSALDVNIKSETINRLGSTYNILNGSLNANEYSTSVDITGYNNCILSYEDSQSLTDAILIFGSINGSNFFYIGAVLPLYYASFKGGAKRFASTKLNLASIKYIQIYNSSSTNITAGKCTLVSA